MRGLKILTAIVLCMLSASGIMAQTDSIKPGFIKAFGNRLDTKALTKYDPLYIEVPERPWRIILRTKFDEVITDFTNDATLRYEDESLDSHLDMKLDSKINKSVGLWVGYRGLGIGYYYKLGKKPDINISVSAAAAKFGLNFRVRSQKYDKLHAKLDYLDPDTTIIDDDASFWTPIDVISFYFNGYYVFNGKHYSQGAAYNQVVVQKKSAGSLLIGATIYASGINMAYKENASLISFCDSVGNITLGKITLGVGYGYNWVPARGWTINAMAMPNISIHDNVIRHKYDCNYSMIASEEKEEYGKWDSNNRIWENGKTHKEQYYKDMPEDGSAPDDIEIWETRAIRQRTCMSFNLDLRLGIAYCWKRYFVSANAIFNHFEYGSSRNNVSLMDWYATASLGIRL